MDELKRELKERGLSTTFLRKHELARRLKEEEGVYSI